MYSDCWAYKDSYLTQSQSEGSCSQYINDPACTVANRQCAYELDGFCLHENLTYFLRAQNYRIRCYVRRDVLLGTAAAQAEAGKNNAFQKAVSELAAVAAAGRTLQNSMAQTFVHSQGKAQFCKSLQLASVTAVGIQAGVKI